MVHDAEPFVLDCLADGHRVVQLRGSDRDTECLVWVPERNYVAFTNESGLSSMLRRGSRAPGAPEGLMPGGAHSMFLDILGAHLWIRCRHAKCLEGIRQHFSCSRSARMITPDIVIECDWDEAGRYLFRARPEGIDGPLEGVRVWIPKQDPSPRDWRSPYPPIPPLNIWPLAERFVGLHGAAVIAPDGDATLLLGERGSGKSTVSLDLVNNGGCQFLTDETVFLHRRTRLVEPFPIAVGVRAGGEPAKRLVAAAEAVRVVADRPALATRVVFLSPDASADCRMERLTEAEGFRALLPHHLDVGADLDEAMVTLVRLSTNARMFRFTYGSYDQLRSARRTLEAGLG